MDTPDLAVNSHLRLPLAELRYRFVRSSGPGGQHVNKAETQVELTFDVAHSPSLSDVQRQRIMSKLKNLIDAEGVLHLTAQSERSQLRNREAVTERFRALLAAALHVPTTRRPTQPSAAATPPPPPPPPPPPNNKQLRKGVKDE